MAQPGAPAMADADDAAPVIELQQICTRFGAHSVHDGLDLTVRRGVVGIGHRGCAGLGHVTAPAG